MSGYPPQTGRMSAVMTDPRPLYGLLMDQAERVILSVRQDQLGLPTPCEEFDVRLLIGHMVSGLRRSAAIARGDSPFSVKMEMPGVPDDAWPREFAEARREAEEAWSHDERLEIMVEVPWAEAGPYDRLAGYLGRKP